ncbi:MAG: DinB family protein [Armatimonadota bacterium]|nr:DinB family protein [bacterium]MDW8103833.1 DinB family protein [Armatimonadota bacterium]MDW8291046.1 DinB family protein [Armatimonadota bacterium]
MGRVQMLAELLERAYRGSRYHALRRALEGVDEEMARWQPPHYKGFPWMHGSILEIAFHAAGDKHALHNTAFGDGRLTWEQIRQQFEADGGDLGAAIRLADKGHEQLLATLRTLSDEQLEQKVPYYHGRRMSAGEIFLLAAEHDLYHAGQIWYVRCLVEGDRAGKNLAAP